MVITGGQWICTDSTVMQGGVEGDKTRISLHLQSGESSQHLFTPLILNMGKLRLHPGTRAQDFHLWLITTTCLPRLEEVTEARILLPSKIL